MNLFSKKLIAFFLLFAVLNIFLYLFILNFNSKIQFFRLSYIYDFHHYFKDPRVNGGQFKFFRAIGESDAQWYLKIANEGYPKNPNNINLDDKKIMGGLTYAFFPLYPLILHVFNYLIKNIELTAFVVSNMFLILNFFSLYFVISMTCQNFPKKSHSEFSSESKKMLNSPKGISHSMAAQVRDDSRGLAIKSIFLLFLFPFSIFYRSYFTEGIYLFLLIWFAYFLIKKKFLFSTICLAFLNVVKANGFLLNFLLFYYLWKESGNVILIKTKDLVRLFGFHLQNDKKNIKSVKTQKVSFKKAFILTIILILPFFAWIIFNYFQTGNPFYFYNVRSAWFVLPIFAPLYNFAIIFAFPFLPFHAFHFSQIDVFLIVLILLLLIKSKKYLRPEFWWVSFLLWLSPLLVTDTMSFSRYQIVSFPIFIFLAERFKSWYYLILIAFFAISLFLTSIFFVNWYWVG